MPVTNIRSFTNWVIFNPIAQKLKTIDYDQYPMIQYPNGLSCYEANMYIYSKHISGELSGHSGGSLMEEAYALKPFIDYCYDSDLKFSQVTDSRFALFMNNYKLARRSNGELKRKSNRARRVGLTAINFLRYVKELYNLDGFIGEDDFNQIKVKKQTYEKKRKFHGETQIKVSYSHWSIPRQEAQQTRLPPEEEDCLKLLDEISNIEDPLLRARDDLIYFLLEETGARVTELTLIKVSDVTRALKSNVPALSLITLKGGKPRELPVTFEFLEVLREFIREERQDIIDNKEIEDHGYLLLNTKTGGRLNHRSITKRIASLKNKAGITRPLHPHKFRHKFITVMLVQIVLNNEDDILTKEDLKHFILYSEAYKLKLQQMTGHRKLSSLDTYIHLAWDSLTGLKKTYDSLKLSVAVSIMLKKLDKLDSSLDLDNTDLESVKRKLRSHIDAFSKDIKASQVINN